MTLSNWIVFLYVGLFGHSAYRLILCEKEDINLLDKFRVAILVYSCIALSNNLNAQIGISVWTTILYFLAPVSEIDREKLTLEKLWEASSAGVFIGFIFLVVFFKELSNLIEIWIFIHILSVIITYIICYLYAAKKEINIKNVILSSLFFISLISIGCYLFTQENSKKSNKRYIENTSKEIYNEPQKTVEKENKIIELITSAGKYGKFTTYIDENFIKYSESYIAFLIGEIYDECRANMPYCEKYKVVTIDCDSKKFVINSEKTTKEQKTIKEKAFTENEMVIRKLSSSRTMSVIAEKYCPTTPYVAPPSYTPKQTNKPSKKDNYQNDYIVPYTPSLTLCRDGTYSHSRGRGTCSHHGGIRH